MEKLYGPMLKVSQGEDPSIVESEARKRSRKQLTSALFALGVDALSRGDGGLAESYFTKCVTEGWYRFYVAHAARAFLAKMRLEPEWADRIGNIPPWTASELEETNGQ